MDWAHVIGEAEVEVAAVEKVLLEHWRMDLLVPEDYEVGPAVFEHVLKAPSCGG